MIGVVPAVSTISAAPAHAAPKCCDTDTDEA